MKLNGSVRTVTIVHARRELEVAEETEVAEYKESVAFITDLSFVNVEAIEIGFSCLYDRLAPDFPSMTYLGTLYRTYWHKLISLMEREIKVISSKIILKTTISLYLHTIIFIPSEDYERQKNEVKRKI